MSETLEMAHDYYLMDFIDPNTGAVFERWGPYSSFGDLNEHAHALLSAGFIILRIHGVSK